MTFIHASFRGIPFHVENASIEQQWRFQTAEYVTNHPPTTLRFGKAPQEFTVEGLVLGRAALLTRDLLARACELDEPGVLIHPLFGLRTVLCLGCSFETFGQASNAFRFSLKLVENPLALDKASPVTTAISLVERAHAALVDYGVALVAALTPLVQTLYAVERAAQLLVKVDGLVQLYAPRSLLGAIHDAWEAALDAAVNLIRTPGRLFAVLTSAMHTLALTPQAARSLFDKLPDASLGPEGILVTATKVTLVLELAKAGTLSADFSAPLTALLDDIDDPALYAMLWDLWLSLPAAESIPQATQQRRCPSLVAAYERSKDLSKAEELARAAGQPFAV